MPARDLHHIAIKTEDLDATVDFYCDLLGARVVDRPPFDFPGAWLQFGSTMIHLYAGHAARNSDGSFDRGGAAVDHVAFSASGFDEMRGIVAGSGKDWRENDIPSANLWQLFVHDPSGVLVELNFPINEEPAGSTGPDLSRQYRAGEF